MLSGQLGVGGVPKVIFNISKNLIANGENVEVAFLGGNDAGESRFREAGIPVTQLGRSPQDPRGIKNLISHLASSKPDVLHTHMAIASAVGRVVGKATQIPVVSTIHTDYKNRTFPAKFIDYTTSGLSDMNISVSSAVQKSLPQSFDFGSHSQIIHNCIDSSYVYQKGNTQWSENNWTDGIPEYQPLVVTVGRFDPKKRHEDLIRALDIIHQKREDVVVAMTGWGDRREQLEKVAQEANVQDSVFFVGKVENPYSLFHHSDIISFQSLHEGFSIAMLEAMAFGTPIVATDIPPFREALGKSYPLVPTRSPNELANKILQFLSDKKMARQLGDHVQERVNERFSGSKAARSYSEVYSKVSDENRKG